MVKLGNLWLLPIAAGAFIMGKSASAAFMHEEFVPGWAGVLVISTFVWALSFFCYVYEE